VLISVGLPFSDSNLKNEICQSGQTGEGNYYYHGANRCCSKTSPKVRHPVTMCVCVSLKIDHVLIKGQLLALQNILPKARWQT